MECISYFIIINDFQQVNLNILARPHGELEVRTRSPQNRVLRLARGGHYMDDFVWK